MERRLGRGLGSLLGQSQEPGEPTPAPGAAPKKAARAAASAPAPAGAAPEIVEEVGRMVDVATVRRNPDQPRKTFESEGLEQLRESILRHGILQPISVRRVENGFEIISGERRWRAARSAGLQEIPAIVKDDITDDVSLELAIVENVQRQDLDALEKARGYQTLMARVGLTQEQVAERVGLKRSTITNQLRLLDLPHDAQEALAADMISMGHAKALLGLKDEKAILGALAKVVRQELSVRETEALARPVATQEKQKSTSSDSASESAAPWVSELEARLREVLGVKITVRNGKKYRGSITLDYANREELERIADLIAPKPIL